MPPRLLLTSGEPAGIGPDLCVLLSRRPFPCGITVLGDPDLLESRARLLGVPIELRRVVSGDVVPPHEPGVLHVLPTRRQPGTAPGKLDPANAAYVLETIADGARACLAGHYDALVTAPVQKSVINEAGIAFTGHTEFIAGITGGSPVMMLAAEGFRVALATTHLPLAEVSRAITVERLTGVLGVLHEDLVRRFGFPRPRILVCGLNPHAGEGGHLGGEEITVIEPVLARLRQEGMDLTGPLPADTLFLPHNLDRADAVLAMYHDQGLPVLKYAGFSRAVNITLGLPIIRTSVDHGTALDRAGTGQIDTGSLEEAVRVAMEMATGRPTEPP
ncbi:4-hydroxythreonine-4-phosphate dehydrogenase PdxA [Methylococcus capsulatus]|jgi:4-hydroxythreonine-4-phosphate dehydrogenase|uniref:4-hydroxythreonine-4-phosphate dehydrogenase n=1 Tax=Methylococcus capsulatus TaxID=414 RepID=A0AA35V285_METCP|nr:4-hydroxythreonine-4-phosphate dehydrogenase PdxA [Methylococcus capsulatus]CAI8756173.1 4-hydroxythreonine-4-phosphate dehydrogenase [Methylococcus capsulatus]